MPTYGLLEYPGLDKFLKSEASATLAVPIDNVGNLHAATLLYWHSENPLAFYFVTNKNSEKCTLFKSQKSINAACVVGTTKGISFTVQFRGKLIIVNPKQYVKEVGGYYQKRGNHHDDINGPANVLLQFTPNWGRFTDYTAGYSRYSLKI